MNWNEVICKNCGSINDYRIEEKSNQRCCYCNGCNAWLGNKPKEFGVNDYNKFIMPYGKYKGQYIKDIENLSYFNWLKENANLTGNLLKCVNYKLFGKFTI